MSSSNRARPQLTSNALLRLAQAISQTQDRIMAASDHKKLEESALLAELARPLVHECNNFLNTLFLQMTIMDKDLPEHLRADWGSIRREGKKLVHLIREWQSHRRPILESGKTELNQLLQDLLHDWRCA